MFIFYFYYRFRNWNTRLTLKGPAPNGRAEGMSGISRRTPSPGERNGQIKEEEGSDLENTAAVNGVFHSSEDSAQVSSSQSSHGRSSHGIRNVTRDHSRQNLSNSRKPKKL